VAIDGEHHTSKAIVIATGSRPHIPAIPGLQHTPYLTTEDIWGLEELPRSMAIIGAGYAACEMGQLLALLGVHVTILNRSARVLSQGDADVSELVGRRLAQDGVEILNNCAINAVSEAGQAIRIDRGDSSIEADCLLVATGRQPEISHLGLEDVGVVHTAKGISVDGIQRTSVGTIFAAGDCTGGSMSAIHARKEGAAAVLAATNHHVEPVAGVHIPRVLYTIPEVAQAGMTEAGARAVHGDRINVYCKSLHELDRALIDVQDEGIMKIVCLRNGGILGITIISPCAGELIGSWCEALRSSEHLKHIAETPYAYPSYLQASVEAAKDLLEESGQPLSKPSLLDMLRKLNK
jgi:pyruvate/2-oxoglutarate dehydrogenase complex dihydrolipoamide dehydrogenase (E3) component